MNQRPEPVTIGGQATAAPTQQAQTGGVASGSPTNEGLQPVSSMPIPPMQYVKLYTDENVRRGTAPQPPPPLHDSYSMFGNVFTTEDCIVNSLESQGVRRLYSAKDVDRKRELKKLNHSVLVNFLDLLEFLIKSPDSEKRVEKIGDLNLLFIHMHHLINEFRPHQARETLRVMLHVQKRKRLQLAEKFHGHLEKVQETIQEALSALPDQDDSDSTTDNKKGVDFSSNNQKDSNQENAIEKARDAVLCELVNDDEMCPVLPMET